MKDHKILIKGREWSVKYVESAGTELDDNDGTTDTNNRIIYIAKNTTHKTSVVYWHEFLHAFFWECGIRDLDEHFEHVLIENLSEFLDEQQTAKSSANSTRRKR